MNTPIRNGWGIFFSEVCRPPQQLWEMLERSGHKLEPIPKAGIVFKIGLILSNKLLRIISGLSISQSCCSRLNPILCNYLVNSKKDIAFIQIKCWTDLWSRFD